jgi:hypothetical protein
MFKQGTIRLQKGGLNHQILLTISALLLDENIYV